MGFFCSGFIDYVMIIMIIIMMRVLYINIISHKPNSKFPLAPATLTYTSCLAITCLIFTYLPHKHILPPQGVLTVSWRGVRCHRSEGKSDRRCMEGVSLATKRLIG